MEVDDIYKLLEKYRENQCTPEEREQIERWYKMFDESVERLPQVPEGKLEQLWYTIENRINNSTKTRRLRVVLRYVAVVAMLVSVSLTYYLLSTHDEKSSVSVAQQGFLPVKGVPVLELSDGRQLVLTTAETIFEHEGQMIKNDSTKILDYTLVKKGKEESPVYNIIKVPVGGEYQILLADGTKVYLNSCSSLRYPVPFTGERREVELTGEAYFEVTKDDKPFVVKTSEVDIKVLGTSFNVSNYQDDEVITTTLVEGTVIVRDCNEGKEYRITPGKTLSFDKNSEQVNLREDDVELYTSWMQGKFVFEDMCLEDIMRKLNRWYDCKIIYADEALRYLRFSGAAGKDRSAKYLLEMIEVVTDVKFEVSGSTILVKRK